MLARVDDLDGSVKDVVAVTFGFKGKTFAVDLGPNSRAALEAALAPFLGVATEYGKMPAAPATTEVKIPARRPVAPAPTPSKPQLASVKTPPRTRKTLTSAAPKVNFKEVRAWAPQNGYTVSDTGRIPAIVLKAYQEANA